MGHNCCITASTYVSGVRRFVLALALLVVVLLQAGGASGRERYSEWLTFNEVSLDGKKRVLSRHNIFPYRSSLSPDRRQLAYVPSVFSIGPSDKLWVAEVRSNGERLVLDAPDLIGDVAWAPSGGAIAITFGDGIWLINPDGTGLRRIAGWGAMLAWSPDSKSLAFGRLDDRLRWQVVVLSLETGEERVLSAGSRPRWSPHARFLLFEQTTGRDEPPKIRRARVTGGAPRTVARGFFPSWSPDGRRIAYLRADQTEPPIEIALWVIDRNGSHRRRIASRVSASDWRPAWSPHARQIAFVKDSAGGCRSSAYVVPVTGGRPNRLARETREILPLGWFSRRRVLYQATRCQS
jgi:Tol biopolymer transport system component